MKLRRLFAGLAAGALAVSAMAISAFAADKDLTTTGTSVTMDDSGIRINLWNPWGGDDTHAVTDIKEIEGATAIAITVKASDVAALGGYKLWINASNFLESDSSKDNYNANFVNYWESEGAAGENTHAVSSVADVTADGEYTVTLTLDEGVTWALGDNNFVMIGSNIDAAAWKALDADEGNGNPATLDIVKVTVTTPDAPAADPEPAPSNDPAPTTGAAAGLALAGIAVAGAALVATKRK
ncbi:MAG: NPXTG-anchored protein [Ruminococcus sp.]|nr:NPXTG-anchored protein [Ruminococcus sp.]